MELKEFEIRIVGRVPESLKFGVLYVCLECNVVVHLCACGCKEKVVLPIDPDFWSVKYDGEHVSLFPSVGNFQFSCQSHYWIKKNRVVWVEENVLEDAQPIKKKKSSMLHDCIRGLMKKLNNLKK